MFFFREGYEMQKVPDFPRDALLYLSLLMISDMRMFRFTRDREWISFEDSAHLAQGRGVARCPEWVNIHEVCCSWP
jgi:hypothetical protein